MAALMRMLALVNPHTAHTEYQHYAVVLIELSPELTTVREFSEGCEQWR